MRFWTLSNFKLAEGRFFLKIIAPQYQNERNSSYINHSKKMAFRAINETKYVFSNLVVWRLEITQWSRIKFSRERDKFHCKKIGNKSAE